MLVPVSWLCEFVPYVGSAEDLGDRLTMLGLELEEIWHPFDYLRGIVTGFVSECAPMAGSDHLHCCKVDTGNDTILDIVCGAPNVAQGQMVAVAPVGYTMPDGTKIKKGKLRGHVSMGMICSERELGLSDDHSGILVLPESVAPGVNLVDALNLEKNVLDLSVTPNRADCLSIIGVARVVAMGFDLPFHVPDLPLIMEPRTGLPEVPVHISDPDLCWLYAGRVIAGVKVAPSPWRIRYRLLAAGLRPVNNVVDVTNYILMETGQPLHAFDLDHIAGKKIEVRSAGKNTEFTTLDGKARQLEPADLCICDGDGIIALAGVMGGLNSEISADSHNVFLESAVFRPQSIRKTSRRLGLISDASFRFERGVDEQRSIDALNRACSLLSTICSGAVQPQLSCQEPKPFVAARIPYRPARCNELLGVDVPDSAQEKSLTATGCVVHKQTAAAWTVIQPSWRLDLTREADLIEEVGILYGVDKLPATMPCIQRAPDSLSQGSPVYAFWQKIREWAAGLGLNEVINYSFVGQEDLDRLGLASDDRIPVLNPLSADQNVLRTQIAPGLLNTLGYNLSHEAGNLHIFELANVFLKDPDSETGAREKPVLGILLYGPRHSTGWPRTQAEMEYPDIKGLVENLLQFLNLGEASYRQTESGSWLTPGVEISLDEKKLGVIGRVPPAIADHFHAQKNVWIAELQLDVLQRLSGERQRLARPLPAFPAVRRDITVMAAPELQAGSVLDEILAMKMPLLEGAALIDCFNPEDRAERNLTFRLTFRHGSRTLKDTEADRERSKVAENLVRKLGVKI